MNNWQEKWWVLSIQPTKQARAMQKGVGKRASWVLPQTTWRRPSESEWAGPTPNVSVTLKNFKLSPTLLGQQTFKSFWLLSCSRLGLPCYTGPAYCYSLFYGEKWTGTCFSIKASNVSPLPGVVTCHKFMLQRTKLPSKESINYWQNFRHELAERGKACLGVWIFSDSFKLF